MKQPLLNRLLEEALLSTQQHHFLSAREANRVLSLNWELKTVLYLGVLLISGGIGVLIYENIDSISHQAILFIISVITFACFYYAYRKQPAFSTHLVQPTSAFASYILLLGCLSFLTLEGYLQFQYQLFGTRYGLATVIPAVVFFFVAYYFDHRGVLSLALTALASWVGVSATPMDLLEGNDWAAPRLIYAAIGLGTALVALGWYLDERGIKKHFTFTYLHFGSNLLFVATLAGLFTLDTWWPAFALLLAGPCYGFIRYARRTAVSHSSALWFLLLSAIYGYIGFTYLVFRWELFQEFGMGLLYFIGSCGAVIYFFLHFKEWAGVEAVTYKNKSN